MSFRFSKKSVLERPVSGAKNEVSLSCFNLFFSEMVQYCQNKSTSILELKTRLHSLGYQVGCKVADLYYTRERNNKRDTKVLTFLIGVKSSLWKMLFGREADKLEQANDDENTFYLIEREPIVNKFISVPKDKGDLNCAAFCAGILEAVMIVCGFPAKVSAHYYQGTTYVIKLDPIVLQREKLLEDK